MNKEKTYESFIEEIRSVLEEAPLENRESVYSVIKNLFMDVTSGERIPLLIMENRIREEVLSETSDKNLARDIAFKTSRIINKSVKKYNNAVNYSANPQHYSDWIPVLAFFAVSLYLLNRKTNNNNTPSSAVIGVRA